MTKAESKRARKLVSQGIDRALAEMREYVNRALLEGREPDKRMMITMSRGLNALAEEFALDLTAGPWGEMIEEAMRLAVADVGIAAGAPSLIIGEREVDAALFKAYDGIKGILADGEKIVAEEMLANIVGGKSEREVADSIAARLRVQDEAGEMGDIPRWRADLIAENEIMVNSRTAALGAAKETGVNYWQMLGPDDDRTDGDVCVTYLKQIHTEAEWESIGLEEGLDPAYPVLQYGFHPRCRHRWVPVPDALVEA